MDLNLGDYNQKGLYLILEDKNVISLTEHHVETTVKAFWEDPTRIPLQVRRDADFLFCEICPEKGTDGICYALRPILPLVEIVDQYFSFDKVTAIFKGNEAQLLYISEASMQTALQYICILSLMSYCRAGRKYGKYYDGVVPIMGVNEAVKRFYLNAYWIHRGNLDELKTFIAEFKGTISLISKNLIKRLSLICKKDAFINAFINMQVFTEFLSMDMEGVLKKTFNGAEKV